MGETTKKLLIIADDHPRVREALEHLVGELHDAVTLYTADAPQALLPLVDKRVAGASGLALVDIRTVNADPADKQPDTPTHQTNAVTASSDAGRDFDGPHTSEPPLIVVSTQEGGITAHWFAAISSGAHDSDDKASIQSALEQRTVVMDLIRSLRQAAKPLGVTEPETTPAVPDVEDLVRLGLTQRQAEVLASLAEGLTNKEIARRLHVSEWTVRHHVSAILERLEVSNRGRAALFARRLNTV